MYKKEHGWTKKTFPLHATMSALKMLFTETFKCVLSSEISVQYTNVSCTTFPIPAESTEPLQNKCYPSCKLVV